MRCLRKRGKSSKATLEGYRLLFNHYWGNRKGGAANIEREDGSYVRGVLFEVPDEDLETLRVKEGYPTVYDEVTVTVKEDDGVVYPGVLTYSLLQEKRRRRNVKPTEKYLTAVMDGAGQFGIEKAWLDRLGEVPCAAESNEPQYFEDWTSLP